MGFGKYLGKYYTAKLAQGYQVSILGLYDRYGTFDLLILLDLAQSAAGL